MNNLTCYHCELSYSSGGEWIEWGWWLEWGTANNPCDTYKKWKKRLERAPFSQKKLQKDGKEIVAVYRCDNCCKWVRRQEVTRNQRQLGVPFT